MDENNTKKDDKVVETPVEKKEENASYTPADNTETTYEPKTIETSKEKKEEKTKKDSSTPKKKSSVKFAIIFILALCLVIGIATAVYFLFFSVTTIDISKYIKVEYDGYNEHATATVELDKALKDEFKDNSDYKSFKKKVELIITSENYDLKNGDELEIKVDISKSWLKKNKLDLKDKTIDIEITGIPELETIDVFEDLEITIEGVSPYLYLSVNNNDSDEFIRDIWYSPDKTMGLANGDTVTITANYNESDAIEQGKEIKKDTMEYKIKDQPYYATSKDDISEDIIKELDKDMIENVKEKIPDGKDKINYHYASTYVTTTNYSDDLVAGEPTLVNLYLLTKKDTDNYQYYENLIYGVYKITYTSQETGATYDWFFTANVEELAITDDGEIYEDEYDSYYYITSHKGESAESIYKEEIDSLKSKYIIEKIK